MDKQDITEQKIKITPKMIDAGCREGMCFNPDFDDLSGFVIDVYKAMRLAYLRGESQTNLSK